MSETILDDDDFDLLRLTTPGREVRVPPPPAPAHPYERNTQ